MIHALELTAFMLKFFYLFFFAIYVTMPVFATDWQEPQTSSSWKGFWGQKDDDCIYTGMWTHHLRPGGNNNNNTNRLLGFNFKSIFAAEYLNSFNKQAYTLGLQRIMYSQKFEHDFQIDAGYRVGLIWGYGSRSPLAGLKKLIPGIQNMDPIPFIEVIGNISWESIGIQFGYCWVVVTVGFFVKI